MNKMTVDKKSYDLAEVFLNDQRWFKNLSDEDRGRIAMEGAQHIQSAIEDFIGFYESVAQGGSK